MKTVVATLPRIAVAGVLLWELCACNRDPKQESLEKVMNLMEGIVRSRTVVEAVQNADPQMQASTAAGAAISGGVTANFPLPPEGIAISSQGKAEQPWSVVIWGDNEHKQVWLEGYGDDLQKPILVRSIQFPPGDN